MKPIVGQRWQYIQDYIVEIINIEPDRLRQAHRPIPGAVQVQVLQKLVPNGTWKIGEIFSPANLNAEGPRIFWTLLEGQDAPNK